MKTNGDAMPLRLQQYLQKNIHNSSSLLLPHTGFIMVRYIQDELTSKYWYKSYQCIRQFYPKTPIVIIDDYSKSQFINPQLESKLVSCRIIASDRQPHCGELLGYDYFFRHHWFQRAIIIHDSLFLQKPIVLPLSNNDKVRFLWHIETKQFDDVEWETSMLKKIGLPYLELYEKKHLWKGCFGVMSIIDYDFLKKISTPLFSFMEEITTRRHRSCMERIFAILCMYHEPKLLHHPSLMGNIHQYPLGWGYHYTTFQKDSKNSKQRFPMFVKVWTGR